MKVRGLLFCLSLAASGCAGNTPAQNEQMVIQASLSLAQAAATSYANNPKASAEQKENVQDLVTAAQTAYTNYTNPPAGSTPSAAAVNAAVASLTSYLLTHPI